VGLLHVLDQVDNLVQYFVQSSDGLARRGQRSASAERGKTSCWWTRGEGDEVGVGRNSPSGVRKPLNMNDLLM
jgi:hypothetical protein